MRKLKS